MSEPAGPPAPPDPPKVGKQDAARAWLSGVTAARTGARTDDCPYEPRTPLAFHWLNGFMSSQR